MRRIAPFLLALLLALPITIGGHAHAQDNDDSAAYEVLGDDDSAERNSAVDSAVPEVSATEAVAAVKTLLDHQRSGWGALLAALLTVVVFVIRKVGLLKKVPKSALPWVAAGIAMVGDVAAALAAGSPIPDALIQGLMLGAAAVGFWEMALKHALRPKEPAGDEAPE